MFLSLDSKVLGALFFTAGLFTICTHGLHLFTGKVCYVFERDLDYAPAAGHLAGELIGTWCVAQAAHVPVSDSALKERAAALCTVKLNDHLLSVFLLAAFCNILIYIAVEGYGKNPHEVGKYLAIFFGVMVFILCGFEHCVANMYYFSMAGMWSGKALLYILVMTLGNAAGGVLFPLVRAWITN